MIYRYFGNREALFKAALQKKFFERNAILEALPPRLSDIMQAWFLKTLEDPDFMRLIAREALNHKEESPPIESEYRTDYYQRQIAVLNHFRKGDFLKESDDATLFLALLALVVFPSAFPQIVSLSTGKSPSDPSFQSDWIKLLEGLSTQISGNEP